MKKSAICLFLVIGIFITGCTQSIVGSEGKIVNEPSKARGLEIITSQNGLFASQYAFTQNGFYEIIEHSTGEGNILYTDFASNERMYLSGDLGLATDDKNNTSYIDNISEGSSIAVTDKNIFILKRGSPKDNSKDESKRTIIEKRDITGGGLEKIYFESSVTLSEGSAVAYDGEYLFFAVTEYSFDNNKAVNGQAKILQLNVDTMKLETVYEFAEGDFVDIKGASEDSLILRKNYFDKEKQQGFSQICTLNINTKDVSEKVNLAGTNQFKVYKDKIYLLDTKDFVLQEINLSTDEKRIVTDIFSKNSFDKISIVADIFDNNLFFSSYIEKTGTTQKWSLDLSNFMLKENTLYVDGYFVGVFGETATDFLAITGEKVVIYTDTAPDKITKIEAERFVKDIKKISKESYWNNKGEYVEIAGNISYK